MYDGSQFGRYKSNKLIVSKSYAIPAVIVCAHLVLALTVILNYPTSASYRSLKLAS